MSNLIERIKALIPFTKSQKNLMKPISVSRQICVN